MLILKEMRWEIHKIRVNILLNLLKFIKGSVISLINRSLIRKALNLNCQTVTNELVYHRLRLYLQLIMLMTLVHLVFHLMWKITWLAKEWSNGCKKQRKKVEMILMRTEKAKSNSTVATPKILKQMVIMLEKSPSIKSKKNIRKEFSNK